MGLYLRLDTIKGGGTGKGHEGWVDLTSVSWSLASSATTMPGQSGGGAGKVTAQAVQVAAAVGPHSPLVLAACVKGTRLKGATLEHTVGGARGAERVDLRWELSAVVVVEYAVGATPEAVGQDTFGLVFGKIVFTTIPQRADGSAGTPVSTTWDPAARVVT